MAIGVAKSVNFGNSCSGSRRGLLLQLPQTQKGLKIREKNYVTAVLN